MRHTQDLRDGTFIECGLVTAVPRRVRGHFVTLRATWVPPPKPIGRLPDVNGRCEAHGDLMVTTTAVAHVMPGRGHGVLCARRHTVAVSAVTELRRRGCAQ
jgi:hypothetical protein